LQDIVINDIELQDIVINNIELQDIVIKDIELQDIIINDIELQDVNIIELHNTEYSYYLVEKSELHLRPFYDGLNKLLIDDKTNDIYSIDFVLIGKLTNNCGILDIEWL
jgi:hypothetical protein